MNFIRVLAFLLLSISVQAQNILSNPGFELYSQCPVNQSQIMYCQKWDSAVGTADFYTCGYYAPSTIGPYGIPATGNGCIGLVASPPYSFDPTNWYGEAIKTDLPNTLIPGEKYELKIDAMINPMGGPGPTLDCFSLGFFFMKKSNQITFPIHGLVNIYPQITIAINELQSGNYQTFIRSFTVDSCYDQMYIGMFCNANTTSAPCIQSGDMEYVDIDNVSMVKTQNAPPIFQGFEASELRICAGDSISISDTSSASNYSWKWRFDGALNSSGNQKTENEIIYPNPGAFDVELITTRECSIDTILKKDYIEVSELPLVTILSDSTIQCTGEPKTLFAQSNDDIFWENGGTGNFRIIKSEGLYIAQSTNQCGTSIDSINVIYEKCDCNVYLPNSFSPNDDQTNDFYSIYYNCVIENSSLIIVNRWGEIIFKGDEPNQKWDGKFNGSDCEEGIYAALLKYKGYSNGLLKQHSIKQAITLVR
jgi:gliding motility-associated-like protein